jgi:hypothetical protein
MRLWVRIVLIDAFFPPFDEPKGEQQGNRYKYPGGEGVVRQPA